MNGGEILRFLVLIVVGIAGAIALAIWVILQGTHIELYGWPWLWADGWNIGFAVALPVVMLVVAGRAFWVLALAFGMTVTMALVWAWNAENGFLIYLSGVAGPALLWPFGGMVLCGLVLRAGDAIVDVIARRRGEMNRVLQVIKARVTSALVKWSRRVCLGALFGVLPGVLAGAGSGAALSWTLYLTTELWAEFVDSLDGTVFGFTKAEEFGLVAGGLAGAPGGTLGGLLGVWRTDFVGGVLGGFVGGIGAGLPFVGFVFGILAGERFGWFGGGLFGELFSGFLIGGGLLGVVLTLCVLLYRLRDWLTSKLAAMRPPESG